MLKITQLIVLAVLVIIYEMSAVKLKYDLSYNRHELLKWEAQAGHAFSVKLLLALRADPNYPHTYYTPLTLAAANGQLKIVRILLSKHANINLQDHNGNTALCSAAEYGQSEIIKLLLARQANLHIADSHGKSPLMHAASKGFTDIVLLLVGAGAALYAPDNAGHTILMWAVKNYINIQTVRTLLNANVALDGQDDKGYSALMHAVSSRNDEIVQELVAAGAVIDARNNRGDTPLMLAVEDGNLEIIRILLHAHADPDLTNNMGYTPLMLAAKEGKYRFIKELLKVTNFPNKRNFSGNNACMLALSFWLPHIRQEAIEVFMHHQDLAKELHQVVTTDGDLLQIIKKIIDYDGASLFKLLLSPRVVSIINNHPELQNLILPNSYIAGVLQDYKEKYLTLWILRTIDITNPLQKMPIELIDEILSYL